MKNQWTVASSMPTVSVIEFFKRDGTHDHDESRGGHLKEAEGYTYVFRDNARNAFSRCSRASVLRHFRNKRSGTIGASRKGSK